VAKNPKNNEACNALAAAISACKKNGVVHMRNPAHLIRAYKALLAEPEPCPADCLWGKMERHQKCNCCARNYRRLSDLYERG
jgi:hypothetical protein